MLVIPQQARNRFFTKTAPDDPAIRWFWIGDQYEEREVTCLLWTGARNDGGLGRFWVTRDRCSTAHRVAYEIAHGEIRDGWEVDHLCRNPPCVEPDHLEAVSADENRRRRDIAYHQTVLTCPNGHPWSEYEQRTPGSNKRRCAQCNRDKVAAWVQERSDRPLPLRSLSELSPCCRNGHRRTEANTYFDRLGVAMCRDCRHDVVARYEHRKKLGLV